MSKDSLLAAQYFASTEQKGYQQLTSIFSCFLFLFQNHLYLAITSDSTQKANHSGKLLRHDSLNDTWDEVYQLPLLNEDSNAYLTKASKSNISQNDLIHHNKIFSEIAIFKGKSDNAPMLYLSLISSLESQLLRTETCESFHVIPKAKVEQYRLSFRQLYPFQNKLYASCLGRLTGEAEKWEDLPIVYVSDDPALGLWQCTSLSGFGDSNNKAISQMVAFNDCLYVGTLNLEQGFQVWKTQVIEPFSYSWKQVISKGAYRYTMNEFVSSMVVFKGNLYVASGRSLLAENNTNEFNTAPPELIRIYPDDSWDLIVGAPKFTPDGLKVPLSAMGPGFDDLEQSNFQCLLVHDNYLYVGVQKPGRFQMWLSEDGEIWETIPLEGITNYPQVELCAAMSTPLGLTLVFDTIHGQTVDNSLSNTLGVNGLEIWIGKEN